MDKASPFSGYLEDIIHQNGRNKITAAKKCGVSQPTITKLCRGAIITHDTAAKLLLLCNSEQQQKEFLTEYANYCLYQISPNYYGNVFYNNEDAQLPHTISRTDLKTLLDYLIDINESEPHRAEALAGNILEFLELAKAANANSNNISPKLATSNKYEHRRLKQQLKVAEDKAKANDRG